MPRKSETTRILLLLDLYGVQVITFGYYLLRHGFSRRPRNAALTIFYSIVTVLFVCIICFICSICIVRIGINYGGLVRNDRSSNS
jgi:hypothetical protein